MISDTIGCNQLPDSCSDVYLVEQIRAGNDAAFATVYERYRKPLLSYCRRFVGRDDAEDALQTVFLAAYRSLLASDREIQLLPWLFTISRNHCLTQIRKQTDRPAPQWLEPVVDGADKQVERRHDLQQLVVDLKRLPQAQRQAVAMAAFAGSSHAEIAGALDVPVQKVRALVFQARESLVAAAKARSIDCTQIQADINAAKGGHTRRGSVRRHLRDCPRCREYRRSGRARRQTLVLAPQAWS